MACGLQGSSLEPLPQGPLLQLGAGRLHAPRCAVSAALALLISAAAQVGCDEPSCGCISASARKQDLVQLDKLIPALLPVLLHVLEPVASELAAAEQSTRASADAEDDLDAAHSAAMVRVMSRVTSPADVAAALSASFKALRWTAGLHLNKLLPQPKSLAQLLDEQWVRLVSVCIQILQALNGWLVTIIAHDSSAASDESVTAGSSQSGGGKDGEARDHVSGSSPCNSWGPAQDVWRASLQEFGVCEAASAVSGQWDVHSATEFGVCKT